MRLKIAKNKRLLKFQRHSLGMIPKSQGLVKYLCTLLYSMGLLNDRLFNTMRTGLEKGLGLLNRKTV